MTAGKLILVTKLKGGSGATTTCRELAAAALKDGQKVALIDLDGQGGLSRWWNRRTAPAANGATQRPAPDLLQLTAAQIPGAAKGLRERYDLVVIDFAAFGARNDPSRRRGVRLSAHPVPTNC